MDTIRYIFYTLENLKLKLNQNLDDPNAGLCSSGGTSDLRPGTGLGPDLTHCTVLCHFSWHNNWPSVLMISQDKSLDSLRNSLV